MLRPAGEARQDQKWRVGIMSHFFGGIRRYYALRTSHDVVVAYICPQLQGVSRHTLRQTGNPSTSYPFTVESSFAAMGMLSVRQAKLACSSRCKSGPGRA